MSTRDWPPHLQASARTFARELAAEHEGEPEVTQDMLLLTDYLAGELDARGVADVEERIARDTPFAELAKPLMEFWDAAAQEAAVPMTRSELEDSWQRFYAKAGKLPDQGPELVAPTDWLMGRRARLLHAAVLAAAVLTAGGSLGVRLFPGLGERQRAHAIEGGVTGRQVVIQDRNRVQLSAGAFLVYTDPESKRHGIPLRLEGSARFTLAPVTIGAYQVITPSAIIEVTGTTFEVDASHPMETRVRLIEGRVLVSSRGTTAGALVMTPGQTVVASFGKAPHRIE